MKINIIGGSGFIGTRLAFILSKKNKNFTIVDKVVGTFFPDKTYISDIRSLEQLRASVEVDAVLINLAAEHRDDITPLSLYREVNVEGAKNVCLISKEMAVNKIIFTSSVAVYGFAPIGTNELGKIAPFNEYGRTKWEAEQVYREWQAEDPQNRTLVIIRPTVVFGEGNRGNVFNLFRQIASGKFIMVGNGLNRKSMAYVENVAAFIEYSLSFTPGVHIYNYVDKPDFEMNTLVCRINGLLGRDPHIGLRIPKSIGLLIGAGFDAISSILGKKFPISSIRVKKFCADSVYESSVGSSGFTPPVSLLDAIDRTICHEFIENKTRI